MFNLRNWYSITVGWNYPCRMQILYEYRRMCEREKRRERGKKGKRKGKKGEKWGKGNDIIPM